MIQINTRLEVADNTGAKILKCFGVVGKSYQKFGRIGDVITGSIRSAIPGSEFKIGDKVVAVIIRTRFPLKRPDGTHIRFDDNACVLIDKDGSPKGTRIFGPVPKELKDRYMKIVSLAPEVL
jgi:large subunit ribosomal protein L14